MLKKIMVIDDDKQVQILLKNFLTQAGYQVKTFNEPVTALQELQRNPYDLIVLDIAMPHMNGLTFLEKIRASKKLNKINIIMLTASQDTDHIVRASKLGITDYLIKPPKKKDVLERVEAILGAPPEFQAVKFERMDRNSFGYISFPVKLERVSRNGIELLSPIPLPINLEFKLSEIPALEGLNLSEDTFKIASLSKENDGKFGVFIDLSKLSRNDKEKLTHWIVSHSLQTKSDTLEAS